jgi:predicted acylesterase/phospholipase RssA
VLVPIEALTFLLAASCARQFGGSTAVIVLGPSVMLGSTSVILAQLSTWSGVSFTGPAPTTVPPWPPTGFPGGHFYRIFLVNPLAPDQLPSVLAGSLDRIVYVTDSLPTAVPPTLRSSLKAGTFSPPDPSQTYFSSFIASIVLGRPAPQKPRKDAPPLRQLLGDCVRDALGLVPEPIRQLIGMPSQPDGFRTEKLDDRVRKVTGRITARPRRPIARDSCRLRLNFSKIQSAWGGVPNLAFLHAVLKGKRRRATLERWARAVTNRRIGLAISGSGATSYRVVPVLEELEQKRVPVDVFGGISGGASVGAYYCRDGIAGLHDYADAGNVISILGILFSGVTSQPIESGMDWAFGGTRLEDLEVRFVPVTTALPEVGPPQARAIVGGTLGAAVRASGALPIFFARTAKTGTVYTDGATSAQIPARALCDYGADYVFACNSVPGPDARNPLNGWPGGEFLYRFTWAGRLLDMFVANEYLLERIGREAGLWAEVFIEMTPNRASMSEIFRWDQAKRLVEEARQDKRVKHGVHRCRKAWLRIRQDPP